MRTTHRFTATGTCPVDPTVTDIYDVEVETEKLIDVESILSVSKTILAEATFQEVYTQRLAELLGAKVTTVGTHSGVETTCEAVDE